MPAFGGILIFEMYDFPSVNATGERFVRVKYNERPVELSVTTEIYRD